MKKFILFALLMVCLPVAFADADTANIRINLSGSVNDNRYFICFSSIGCLSIKAAQNGKVYPIYRPIQLYNMYITDVTSLALYRQNLPSSCSGEVELGKTLVISGNLRRTGNDGVAVSGLHCTIR